MYPEAHSVASPTKILRLTNNYILNALPDDDFRRMLPDLEKVNLAQGQIIWRPDERIDYVYFPNDAMISEIAITPDGESAEVGVIGREGLVGIDILMGVDQTFNQRIVQLAGSAIRMKSSAARKEFKRGEAFHDAALLFMRLMLTQISQTALCNRLHTVEERLARWLLMCRDRSASGELTLAQEFLAVMLGVGQASVTISAFNLQSAKFIKYQHGKIAILDYEALEDFACTCYRNVKDEYDRYQRASI